MHTTAPRARTTRIAMGRNNGTNLGITGYDVIEFVVNDLPRSRRFYEEMMDVPEVARLSGRASAERGEDASIYRAGKAIIECIAPKERGSRAERWLSRHPDGVSVLGFRVRDVEHTRRLLEERGACLVSDGIVESTSADGSPRRHVDIASPLGDVRFRFTQREPSALPEGFDPVESSGEQNRHGFQVVDHVTSNMLTMQPHIAFLRDVMGFEEYWRVHFHTSDVQGGDGGSGLASIVMWDPESGIKLANNEPAAPSYENSQIYTFVEDNQGAGVQHVAFHVPEILGAVEGLRERGIQFLDTPATYYDMLPARMATRNVTNISENVDDLRRLGILVDGDDDRYLLQIFMVEGGVLYDDRKAGPFFYEVIQRRGARGFGEGNFRALFEAIERDQKSRTSESVRAQLDAGAGS
jgi:4-hydroxyphenylpyruvate dioxygenase